MPNSILSIDSAAFENTNLRYIYIPDGVIRIGHSAFSGSQLQTVRLPQSLRFIEGAAFENNNLISLSLPSAIIEIGERAFNGNNLPDSQAFIFAPGSNNSVLVSYGGNNRNPLVPHETQVIAQGAFLGAQIDSVFIPTGVTRIEVDAFRESSLRSVVLPSTLSFIGGRAFSGNQFSDSGLLSSVRFEGQLPDLSNWASPNIFGHNPFLGPASISVPLSHLSSFQSKAAEFGILVDRFSGN